MRALRSPAVVLLALTLAPAATPADVVDRVGKNLVQLQADAAQLEQGLERPRATQRSQDLADRRLVEAQVAYGVGNYATASIILYNLVERFPDSRSYREAVFYLADSLFKKGDYLTAREYFRKIVYEFGSSNPHYQEALQRLLELSLRLDDPDGVPDYLARLDRVPQGSRLPSVPYVRGKYEYFAKNYDQALASFRKIGKSNKYYFQARYFLGTTHVAQGDLAAAAKIYRDLLKQPVKDADGKRVVELTYLALGRIHYEREQYSNAIDNYLKISRRSDLFDDALFEVAWVYVKAKQFDKALRALELLSLANPKSAMLPEVRILEGNLRIRKAQALQESGAGNVAEEYEKALKLFKSTGEDFETAREKLKEALAQHDDPQKFFSQITGQAMGSLDISIELPKTAVDWVQDEPEVGRVVDLTKALSSIRTELDDTEELLDRLDRAVSSPMRVHIFPELADRRARAQEIAEGVFAARQQLATHERVIVGKYANAEEKAELSRLRAQRMELARKLSEFPDSEASYTERIKKARQRFTDLDKKANEVEVVITSIEAELVAIEKYVVDTADEQKTPREQIDEHAAELRASIADLRAELDAIRKEVAMAQDAAGVADELAAEERRVRKDLDAAVTAEHHYMQRIVTRMSGSDRTKADQIATLIARTDQIEAVIDRVNRKIDAILDAELVEVRQALTEERSRLGEYRQTLLAYESENRQLGSQILFDAFGTVADKFYSFVVRADLGVVDVAWARKEESKDAVQRMTLDSAREERVLREEFRDVLAEPEDDEP